MHLKEEAADKKKLRFMSRGDRQRQIKLPLVRKTERGGRY